jgi:hypothetical protein
MSGPVSPSAGGYAGRAARWAGSMVNVDDLVDVGDPVRDLDQMSPVRARTTFSPRMSRSSFSGATEHVVQPRLGVGPRARCGEVMTERERLYAHLVAQVGFGAVWERERHDAVECQYSLGMRFAGRSAVAQVDLVEIAEQAGASRPAPRSPRPA